MSGIVEFNEFVKNDSEVEQLILSIRDGLMLIRKVLSATAGKRKTRYRASLISIFELLKAGC